MTRTDVLVTVLIVLLIFAFLLALLLPVLAASKRHASRINCFSNIKQVNLSFRIWEGDHDNLYPMGVSTSIGGAMECVAKGDVIRCFQRASNEMSTTKILICPNDTNRTYASNFDALKSTNISYFIGADATSETNPGLLLSGDDNFAIGGVSVKSGLLELPTNAPISWTTARHIKTGNFLLGDGSVGQSTTSFLRTAWKQTGMATNRLIIP